LGTISLIVACFLLATRTKVTAAPNDLAIDDPNEPFSGRRSVNNPAYSEVEEPTKFEDGSGYMEVGSAN